MKRSSKTRRHGPAEVVTKLSHIADLPAKGTPIAEVSPSLGGRGDSSPLARRVRGGGTGRGEAPLANRGTADAAEAPQARSDRHGRGRHRGSQCDARGRDAGH